MAASTQLDHAAKLQKLEAYAEQVGFAALMQGRQWALAAASIQ